MASSPTNTITLTPNAGPTHGGTAVTLTVPPHTTSPLILATDTPGTPYLNCTRSGGGNEATCCCTPPADQGRSNGASVLRLRVAPTGWPAHSRFEHFAYYESPGLVSLKPTSGRASGGASITIAAKGWPLSVAPATRDNLSSSGARCRFGVESNSPTVAAAVLGADARSKTVARGKRPADETWIRCVAPASTTAAARDVPVFVAPNGIDFDTRVAPLSFHYEGGGGGAAAVLASSPVAAVSVGGGLGGVGGLLAVVVVLALVAIAARSLLGLRAAVDSSGWADGTPTHWSAGRPGSEQPRVDDEADDEERLVDATQGGGPAGATPSAVGDADGSADHVSNAELLTPAKIDITTADKELASDLKRLLVLAGTEEDFEGDGGGVGR